MTNLCETIMWKSIAVTLIILSCMFAACGRAAKSTGLPGTYQALDKNSIELITLGQDLSFQHVLKDAKSGSVIYTETGTYKVSGGLVIFNKFMEFYSPMTKTINLKGDSFISYKMHILYLDGIPQIKPGADQEYFFKRL